MVMKHIVFTRQIQPDGRSGSSNMLRSWCGTPGRGEKAAWVKIPGHMGAGWASKPGYAKLLLDFVAPSANTHKLTHNLNEEAKTLLDQDGTEIIGDWSYDPASNVIMGVAWLQPNEGIALPAVKISDKFDQAEVRAWLEENHLFETHFDLYDDNEGLWLLQVCDQETANQMHEEFREEEAEGIESGEIEDHGPPDLAAMFEKAKRRFELNEGTLTDDERQLLGVFVTQAWVNIRNDPDMVRQAKECEGLLRKIQGVDKQIVVRTLVGGP